MCCESSQLFSSKVVCQVKSSSNFMGAPAGARDREGAARRIWHGCIALSRGFSHAVFFLQLSS